MFGNRLQRRKAVAFIIVVLSASGALALSDPALVEAAESRARVDPGVLGSATPTVLVHAVPGRWDAALRAARSRGLDLGSRYQMIDVFVATGQGRSVIDLASSSAVAYLENNDRLYYATDTSHKSTRGQEVLDGKFKLHGHTIDGRGVGVAIVDSGVDGTHPDLVENMGGNVMIVCTRPGFLIGTVSECGGPKEAVELDDTDTPALSGHGTHVAGIVAGTGVSSDGKYHGAAPRAKVYGVGMGTVLFVQNALDGLRWVLDNHDLVRPRIRVLNASWGSGYDPADAENPAASAIPKMINALVKDGVTVVFSAGNAGGDGSEPTTSLECTIPTPGVICVASYDDLNLGTRKGVVSSTSSRGDIANAETWPDVAAPGSAIVSTCRATLPMCYGESRPEDHYATLSGTSMAAPHVTGIVALLYQVRPSLTPAEVEDLVEDTAYKFDRGSPYEPDPFNKDDKSSFEKGHGLIDALAAIKELLSPR